MFIHLKAIAHGVLLPPGSLLLLALLGLWLLQRAASPRLRRAGRWLLTTGLLTLWLLSTPWVADLLGSCAQRVPFLDPRRPIDAQAIVILAGGSVNAAAREYGGAPVAGLGLLERLAYGAWLARRTALPVVVSGTPRETAAMVASLAREFGVPVRWVESRSRDTFENAYYCARLLQPAGISRIVLVTDNDHEWRALQEFHSAGFAVTPAPAGVWGWQGEELGVRRSVPNAWALLRSSNALYELVGDFARRVFVALHLRRQTP